MQLIMHRRRDVGGRGEARCIELRCLISISLSPSPLLTDCAECPRSIFLSLRTAPLCVAVVKSDSATPKLPRDLSRRAKGVIRGVGGGSGRHGNALPLRTLVRSQATLPLKRIVSLAHSRSAKYTVESFWNASASGVLGA